MTIFSPSSSSNSFSTSGTTSPGVLFGNLARIWNDYIDNKSAIDLKEFQNWVNAHIYASTYKIRTVQSNIGKPKPVFGGLGRVSYIVAKINKPYYLHLLKELGRTHDHEFINDDYSNKCRWLEILCRLGELTNVGANRTAAMGVMPYHPNKYLSKSDLLLREIY
ncbi:MAG: CRISPR system precrRNA processing endoribonuclease RAMP protein Cas6 [Promethearchaeota archaeon]